MQRLARTSIINVEVLLSSVLVLPLPPCSTDLLEVVGEVDEGIRRAGTGHQEENLRAPELDVALPDVQSEKELADLR